MRLLNWPAYLCLLLPTQNRLLCVSFDYFAHLLNIRVLLALQEFENTVDQGGVGENGSELRQFTYLFYNTVNTESVSGNYVLHYETACKVPDTCSGIDVGPGLFSFDIAASVCPTAISATTVRRSDPL